MMRSNSNSSTSTLLANPIPSSDLPSSTANSAIAPPTRSNPYKERKHVAHFLASQYSTSKRFLEIISIVIYLIFLAISLRRVISTYNSDFLPVLLFSLFFSMIASDFLSGILHWSADTWGDLNIPIVKAWIRSFREHHVDPLAITRHDVIECNGDSCLAAMWSLIFLVMGLPLGNEIGDLDYEQWKMIQKRNFSIYIFITITAAWAALTNQIHSWSHNYRAPKWVKFLQRLHIILPPNHHQIHHKSPFDCYYCITNGWLNYPLQKIGFWRGLEKMVTYLIGSIPRKDDAVWYQKMQMGSYDEDKEDKKLSEEVTSIKAKVA